MGFGGSEPFMALCIMLRVRGLAFIASVWGRRVSLWNQQKLLSTKPLFSRYIEFDGERSSGLQCRGSALVTGFDYWLCSASELPLRCSDGVGPTRKRHYPPIEPGLET